MRRTVPLLLAALALVGAGCGSDDDESASTSTGAAAETATTGGDTGGAAAQGDTVTVDMASIQFDPKVVEAEVGQTIQWVNKDSVPHDAASTSGDEFKSDVFGEGETFEYTAEKPGTIEYECTLHPGMVGTIEVR